MLAAPFTVRSTSDFENTDGTEHDHMTVPNCSDYTNFKVGAPRTSEL